MKFLSERHHRIGKCMTSLRDEFMVARELCELNKPSYSWLPVQVDGQSMKLPGEFTRIADRAPVVGDLL